MDVQRLFDHPPQRRLMAFPSERSHREVGVDALDGTGVERAVAGGGDAAERHAFRLQVGVDGPPFGPCALADRSRLAAEIGAHLDRESRDGTEAEKMRSVPLVGLSDARPVAAEEAVLRLRSGAVRTT